MDWWWLVSTYVVCERLLMHKQVSGWTVKFCPNFPESPFLEFQTRKPPPPPPILENFRFEMTKVYFGIPPHFGKLQIWDDQSLCRNTPPPPHFGKLQIWDDQSLLQNTPPPPPPTVENFRFEMTKVYSGIPPPPISENAGDRMWRLICNPQRYHSFSYND